MKKERIDNIKRLTKPVDALPLIKLMTDKREKMSDKDRKELLKVLIKGFKSSGEMLLKRCFLENIITEEEWKEMKDKYNLTEADMSPVLQGYFNRKDKVTKKEDKIVIVTMENTSIFKNRDVLKKKFDVMIVSAEEGIEILKKEHPKEWKKFMKEREEKKIESSRNVSSSD